ncbi:MAG: hypothetical protein Q4Q04_02145 [Methanocorpusculum sp.]|nr:hypothetical protein [Methanocorpusculum sp.]
MSDIRIRLLTLCAISLAAFAFPLSAIAAFIWWLVFAARDTVKMVSVKKIVLLSALVSVFPTVVLLLSGVGHGALIYGGKIVVLLLLALWFGSAYRAGEFLDFFVWLLGSRRGFAPGLAAEFTMTQAAEIKQDAAGFLRALRLKGKKLSVRTLPAFAFGVLMLTIRRAELSSKLLARRGYAGVGTRRPLFARTRMDSFRAAGAAVTVGMGIINLIMG